MLGVVKFYRSELSKEAWQVTPSLILTTSPPDIQPLADREAIVLSIAAAVPLGTTTGLTPSSSFSLSAKCNSPEIEESGVYNFRFRPYNFASLLIAEKATPNRRQRK